MFLGLLVTFLTGYYISVNEYAAAKIFGGKMYIFVLLLEVVLALFLSARVDKLSPTVARICFLLYSFVTGITIGAIFITYELTSVIYTLLVTSTLFGLCAVFGKFTKLDLTKIGTYLFIGLIGIILCSVINIFIGSSRLEFLVSIGTIIVFSGFTAYDVQRIGYMDGYMEEDNLAIYGALRLYLDFINLFLELLKYFGKIKNND